LKALSKIEGGFDRLLGALMFVACTIFIFAMLLVCADVVMRYALNAPILWGLEVSECILVGIVSLGVAWLLKEDGHVKVDFLLIRLRPENQALVNGITSALSVGAVGVITWYGIGITYDLLQTNAVEVSVLNIGKGILLIPLSIGMLLTTIQLVRRSYSYLKFWVNKKARN